MLFQRNLLMLEALKQISGLLIRLNGHVEYGDYVGYGGQVMGTRGRRVLRHHVEVRHEAPVALWKLEQCPAPQ